VAAVDARMLERGCRGEGKGVGVEALACVSKDLWGRRGAPS
jgi:hypothetical protein